MSSLLETPTNNIVVVAVGTKRSVNLKHRLNFLSALTKLQCFSKIKC